MSSKQKGGGKDGSNKSGSYEVGYAKPPEHGKFKPGVSGNPHGRPMGRRNRDTLHNEQNRLRDIINEEAERIVTIQTPDGKTKKITTTQALIRAINLNGLKGQQRAQRHAIELIGETQRIAQAQREETFARWAQYKQDWSRASSVDRAAALPHPDHVKLDTDALTVTFAGPVLEDERAPWRRWTAIRARIMEELKELQKYRDHPDLPVPQADMAKLIGRAEETLLGIGLALGGSRPIMNFLQRLDVSVIEAKCQKKRRRRGSYVFADVHFAMYNQWRKEEGKR